MEQAGFVRPVVGAEGGLSGYTDVQIDFAAELICG